MSDSVSGRLINWVSLLGDGDDLVNGKYVTKSHRRLPLHVGHSLFRKFTCTEFCHVCCSVLSVSLDYIPTELSWFDNPRKDMFTEKKIDVNGQTYAIFSREKGGIRTYQNHETDSDVLRKFCEFLAPIRPNGGAGCSLWQTGSPLGCASSYSMRVSEHPDRILITKTGMSRKWRYDPAPECTFHDVPIEESDIETNIGLLGRFAEWAIYFDMTTSLHRIVDLQTRLQDILRTGSIPERIVLE